MELLMPEMVDKDTLKDVQAAMRKDLRIAAKKLKGRRVFFIVAADVPLKDKSKCWLFVAVKTEAEAKAWELKLRGKKKVPILGTCGLETKDGKNVRVAFDKVKGDRKMVLTTARRALKLAADPYVQFSDPLVEGTDEPDDKASAAAAAAEAAAESKAATAAAKTSAAVLAGFGATAQQLAKELNLSVEDLNLIIANNAAALKAAVNTEIRELKEAAK